MSTPSSLLKSSNRCKASSSLLPSPWIRRASTLLGLSGRIVCPLKPNSVLALRIHGDGSNELDALHRFEDFKRELGVDIRVDEAVLAFWEADPHVPSRRLALVEDLQSPVTAPELDEVRPQVGPPVCERLLFLTCEQALV